MAKRISSFENFPYDTEQLRITKNSLSVRLNMISGKDGDFWVCISPSLNVSGYGKNIDEAKSSFNENIDTFCEDVNALSTIEKRVVLKKMGFSDCS